jgi:hypothetical protein
VSIVKFDPFVALQSLRNLGINVLADRRTGRFASHYGKRYAEVLYDKAMFDTPLGKRIRQLPNRTKYVLEAIVYGLDAWHADKLPEKTAFEVFVKEMLGDAPSEIASRMFDPAGDPDAVIGEIITVVTPPPSTPAQKAPDQPKQRHWLTQALEEAHERAKQERAQQAQRRK